jgi:hypothetical protein
MLLRYSSWMLTLSLTMSNKKGETLDINLKVGDVKDKIVFMGITYTEWYVNRLD